MLKEGERLDDLNRDGLKIIQNPKKFCFGIDAVLLSDFAKVHRGQICLDLCTGGGVIPILLAAKTKGQAFHGIEIQEEVAEMATRSVLLNNLQDKVKILCGDLKTLHSQFSTLNFNVVTANPPYMPVGHGEQSPQGSNAIARHEIMCTLDDVVAAAARALVPHGKFYMVHRPARLADIFASFAKHNLAPKVLRLVQPRAGQPPNLLLISATKGGSAHLKMEAPLIIYGEDGKYTKEVLSIHGYE
ncbi:MAG: tRNA1(Val) (adenine(37)-N6)-methyltransferase [Defluviitaleaceae bacterium]|nr:tRNA1(Val) (adenine(37)-N6)-methyltransferase [Defluviitaleaceae bacterium]